MRRGLAIGLFTVAALAGCSTETPQLARGEEEIVDIPSSRTGDQRETGNCWLYATTAWVESLERGAHRETHPSSRARPQAPLSIAYLDYWDWYSKITGGEIRGSDAKAMREDQLDSGGSWGYAVEVMARYGLARASAFGGTGITKDADLTNAALDAIVASLLDGPLKTPASRSDGALVRKELDKAFKLSAQISAALTTSFGADGKKSFTKGTAEASDVVIAPDAFEILVPRADATSVVRPLSDAIGHRAAPGDDPDQRAGEFAWHVVPYARRTKAATRAYFRRIQRALHAGVPIPVSWFLAANGDPDERGAYREVPADPADIVDSVPHQTVIADYDSKRVGVNDLYVEYLTGTVRVCPAGVPRTSRACHKEIPLEDVTLPAGF